MSGVLRLISKKGRAISSLGSSTRRSALCQQRYLGNAVYEFRFPAVASSLDGLQSIPPPSAARSQHPLGLENGLCTSQFARHWHGLPLPPHVAPPGLTIQRVTPWAQRLRFFSEGGAVDVLVPSMGESVSDGAISTLLKGPGDAVAVDDIIAQIETDKVTIDVRSPEAGVLQKLTVKVGETVTPGTVVAIVGKDGAAAPAEAAPEIASPAAPASAEEPVTPAPGVLASIVVPSMGESVSDGVIADVFKNVGDAVQADEVIAQIETDKVTIDVRSSESGYIERIDVKKGDTVSPGVKVALLRKADVGAAAPAAEPKLTQPAAAKPATKSSPPPTPERASPPALEVQKILQRPIDEPKLIIKERERRVPMTRLRRRVAQRLKDSQNTFALLTTFNEVDMTNLMQMRSAFKDEFVETHGVKLGFMSAFVKAAATALKREPVVNAVIDGDDVIYRDYIDISIAVGTPKGLVVPVIRRADELGFAGIEKAITELGKKAKDGTISIDDMAGGTFTISNGGVYGSLISTPIINPPQSAILGMHAVQQRPMVVGKEILPRPMMYVALTYDHRLIDGREAVLFLRRIKDVVEDPRRLLLDL